MIDAIVDFFLSVIVDTVVEAACGVFAFFGGKRRRAKNAGANENMGEGAHD